MRESKGRRPPLAENEEREGEPAVTMKLSREGPPKGGEERKREAGGKSEARAGGERARPELALEGPGQGQPTPRAHSEQGHRQERRGEHNAPTLSDD